MDKYDYIYKKAKDVYAESNTGGGKSKPPKKEEVKNDTQTNFNK
jgi:hypothetical protein